LISAVAIARLLTPDQIGVFSIAMSLVGFAHVMRDFGISQYLIQLKIINREALRAAFSAALCTSWSVALALVLIAPLAAKFYRQNGIGEVFLVLALSFALLPFAANSLSLLRRDMQFERIAVVQIANGLISTIVTLVLAWRGHGFLSMAWGAVAGNVSNLALLWFFRPDLILVAPGRKGLAQVFRFGGQASVAAAAQQLAASGPDLVFGRSLSVEAVAQFNRASSPLAMISTKINEISLQVFGPAFARGLREGQSAKDLLHRSICVHSGLQIALLSILSLVSGPMILFLFGGQWQPAAQLAPWVTLWAVVACPISLVSQALMSGGFAGAAVRSSIWSTVALMLVLSASWWVTLEEVVWLLLLHRLAQLCIYQRALQRCFGFGWDRLWTAIRPSLWLAVHAVLPALAARWLLYRFVAQPHVLLELVLVGCTGALAYVVQLRRSMHPIRKELLAFIPQLAWLLGPGGSVGHTAKSP